MAEIGEYIQLAAEAIEELLAEHHAAVKQEIESRISEGEYAGSPNNIDPHHVTTALTHLTNSGRLIRDLSPAKGGRQDIATYQPADRYKRATKIDVAAARKRLLLARYNGWAESTARYPNGLIGPAREEAARTGIVASGAMQPATPHAGEVSNLLGVQLPGAADSGGYVVPLINNLPGRPVTVIIEVKNIRGWIYPSSIEVYQVLDKAAHLQLQHPDQPIAPILICRKAHDTAFWMAGQLGLTILETGRQFAGNVAEDAVAEVRNELYFHDLHAGSGPSTRIRDRFRKTIPKVAPHAARNWAATCRTPSLPPLFAQLRHATMPAQRTPLMRELRRASKRELRIRGGW